jgi:predicted amidohydrolase
MMTVTSTSAQEANTLRIEPMSPEQIAHNSVRVAAVQVDSPWIWTAPIDPNNDPADKLIPYIERAASDKADLVVFPELYLGMFKVPSPQTEKISAAARKHEINVIVGCFEVTDEKGNYGNSSLIFNRKGEIIGRYFKAAPAVGSTSRGWPPEPDDPEWMMTPGQEFPVFDLDFGRIGIMTCYDGYFPEIPRILTLKGAEVIIWPNARGGSIEDYLVRSMLHYNYVHVVSTNKAIGAGTSIAEWPTGIKAIVDKPDEGYIVTDLGLDHLRGARIHAREFHQRVPEIYAEIAEEWPVWEQYGTKPDDIVPKPDLKRREEILQNIGVTTPAAK